MSSPGFQEWLLARETTAFTRARMQAALGLGPDIPDAEINSHDTAPPWQQEIFKKRHHKKKRKSNMAFTKFSEWVSKKSTVKKPKKEPTVHSDLDSWLGSVDNLKKDLSDLKDTLFKGKVKGEPAPPEDNKKVAKDVKAKFGFGKKAEKEVPEGGPIKPIGDTFPEEPETPKKKFVWGKKKETPPKQNQADEDEGTPKSKKPNPFFARKKSKETDAE